MSDELRDAVTELFEGSRLAQKARMRPRNVHDAYRSLSGCTLPRERDPDALDRICAFVGLPKPAEVSAQAAAALGVFRWGPARTWQNADHEVCCRCTLAAEVCSCHARGED